jgi:hypothetical protein
MYRAIFSALHAENMARNHRKLQCHIRMRRGEYVRYPHICWSSGQQRSHSALKGHTHLYYFDSNGGLCDCQLLTNQIAIAAVAETICLGNDTAA